MDSEDIPEVIASIRQNQLIFLTGLDIANNKSHAAIFSAFTVNREPDRPPIRFVILNGTQTFRETKAQRPQQPAMSNSRGFIKIDWLNKYVNELPSVIVLFADLGWDHPSWNEKVTECESKISSLRTSIGSHATRICVVLLQQNSSIDNPLATERASKICQICQLPTKQLFVLPIGERMFGSILRLEIAFHELAQAFFQQCLKSIRAKSIPNNSSNLIIRQQFKLGFISELRQDTHTALRHYKLAYQHCTECEIIDSELFELRCVAGLLNYKICQLLFLHSTALEAVSQQRRHNAVFFSLPMGSYPSPALASIEHILWKGKQCSLFANLFERAIMNGLVAVSTQHPGLYLQAAVYYYRQANEAAEALKSASHLAGLTYPSPDPLAPTSPVFYGQRPWRAAVENGDLADAQTEKNACIALQLRCSPNHDRCLALLSSAMAQFKKYKCLRMQRCMMLLLSEEYCSIGKYVKALQFASHLLWECRCEGFIQPISMLLLRALICAYRTADVKEFMTLSMQILNLRIFPSFASIADQIISNISLIRKGLPPQIPFKDANLSQAEVETCQQLWKSTLGERVFFSISAPHNNAFIRARVAFLTNGTETIYSNSAIFLMVALSSYAAEAVVFERMKIIVSEDNGNKRGEQQSLYEFTKDNVEVAPAKETVKILRISLSQSCYTVAKKLVVSGLSLEMGSVHSSVYGTLDWDAQSLSYGSYDNSYANSILDACIGCTTLSVEPRRARFRIEGTYQSEALLGEIATVPLSLVCEETTPVQNVRVDWNLDEKDEVKGLFFVSEENQFVLCDSKILQYSSPQTPPFKIQLQIRYCAQTVCSANILVVTSVVVDGVTAQERFLIHLQSRPPFDISSKILTISNEVVENPLAETCLFARTDITTNADIVVSDISWKPGLEIEVDDDEQMMLKGKKKTAEDVSLSTDRVNLMLFSALCRMLHTETLINFIDEVCCLEGDVLSVCAPVRFSIKAAEKKCGLGEIHIRWRRQAMLQEWLRARMGVIPARCGIGCCD